MTKRKHPAAPPTKPLDGRVAVVAGATRGAGRGIACGLGEAGATVYCTGRSTRGNPSDYGRPETIEETADMVNAAGGTGIAVRVDHTVEAEVQALFARVDGEQGRLDVLATSVGGEDPRLGGWGAFWETDLSDATGALRGALLSHLITAKHAAPIMVRQRRGLIVEVTSSDLLLGGGGGNLLHNLVKHGTKGLALMMAGELRPHRVAAIAITPGYLRSESMLQHFGVTETSWREAGKKDPHFLASESPLFIGRAVAALAADRKVLARTGDVTCSWDVAREYGLADADGSRPDWGKHGEEAVIPSMKWMKDGLQRYVALLERHAGRARGYLGEQADKTTGRATPRARASEHEQAAH
ncbi:MAG TPA: SDR family NAD(P)-dependent oxidoreductase [Gemmatimonadaceae bacterium]|nr:SDR family NAD(P)-dependent oxidoreductase [Gemmatimonadaceae bacterium]